MWSIRYAWQQKKKRYYLQSFVIAIPEKKAATIGKKYPFEMIAKAQVDREHTLSFLPDTGNLLVWGLGRDSPFWTRTTTKGRVIFLEDGGDIPSLKYQSGTLWYDEIMQLHPELESYKVHYTTDVYNGYDEWDDYWAACLGNQELQPPQVVVAHI